MSGFVQFTIPRERMQTKDAGIGPTTRGLYGFFPREDQDEEIFLQLAEIDVACPYCRGPLSVALSNGMPGRIALVKPGGYNVRLVVDQIPEETHRVVICDACHQPFTTVI